MQNGKICISVFAETAQELSQRIRYASELADIVEVRIDGLQKEEFDNALELLTANFADTELILTFRSQEKGGMRESSRAERMKFWQKSRGTAWTVDLDESDLKMVADGRTLIASFHDYGGVPDDIEAIYDRLAKSGAGIIKIAATADEIVDTIPIWNLINKARKTGKRIIPIAMGDAGGWTRILGISHGSYLTFASLDKREQTAPGQFTVDELRAVYRADRLNRCTSIYGVIGDPVSGSFSPYMHNAAFAKAEVNAVFLYLPVKELDSFITRMVNEGTREIDINFAGFAVTMPHKQAIMRYLDEIDPVARAIGAVNTVKIDGGKLLGFNTDAGGFIEPLTARFGDLRNARVAVFGTGGAARACVYALKQENADITVFSRNRSRAESLGIEFGAAFQESKSAFLLPKDSHFDLLVNATPLGMNGVDHEISYFSRNRLGEVKCIYDLVTKAEDTPLVAAARASGIETIKGIEMLVAQGERQFKIWTGRTAPEGVMENAIKMHKER